MDSEHRHELKTNELADLLTHFPEFLKRNTSTIIGITLIVIGLISWPLLTKMSRQKTIAEESKVSKSIQMLGQDIRNAVQSYQANPEQLSPALNTILVNADALVDLTSETDNPNLAALAYIKAAQAIRTELHLKKEVVSTETIDAQTQKAQTEYEKAAQTAEMPAMKAMAQFGIGLCTEERGQTQQAAEIYEAIVNDETFAATVFPKLAQQRLDSLDDNAESFTFVDTTPAEIEEIPVIQSPQSPEEMTIDAEPQADVPAAPAATVEPDSEE